MILTVLVRIGGWGNGYQIVLASIEGLCYNETDFLMKEAII